MRKNLKKICGTRVKKGIWIGLLVLLLSCMQDVTVQAETIDFQAKVVELQNKFPHGKYWNHVGMTTENVDGYTENPCTLHDKLPDGSHTYDRNGCTCNHFTGSDHLMATQCMGFANKLAYDVFGATTWNKISAPNATQIADIRVGDIVRFDYDSHSTFVIARMGNNIMVGEANYPNGCRINWGRIIDLSTANITYYERAANYDLVIGNQTSGGTTPGTTEAPTTETTESTQTDVNKTETPTTQESETVSADFTGWKETSDGAHYRYYKKGTLQKAKWITVKKKKYYVDENGYRVTGFYDVKGVTYYFNDDGVMQKNQWFTKDGETYHVNKSGLVLKSQWLYYKNTLVYVTKDGSIAKSEIVKIGSKKYYFNAKGKRSKGFKKYKGKYYYTNSSGVIQKKKWITKGKNRYYVQKSGVRVQTKLIKIGKYRYYFDKKGRLVKNKRITYNDKIYKADKKGRCKFVRNLPKEEEYTTQDDATTEERTETTTQSNTEATAGDKDFVTDLSK